jgi:hypothetical protein
LSGRRTHNHFDVRIAILCLLVALAGCTKATTSATPPPSEAPTSAPTSPPQSSSSSVPATPQSTRCHTADLTASLEDGGAAAGTHYRYVVLTNSNGPTCTLYGYPGVSLVDASGAQIGKPAERNPVKSPRVVTLAPRASGFVLVGFPNPGNYSPGVCSSAQSASLRVYPPDELRSLLVTLAGEKWCPGFTVSAITATKQ